MRIIALQFNVTAIYKTIKKLKSALSVFIDSTIAVLFWLSLRGDYEGYFFVYILAKK